jgi:CBS domain-containing protein
VEDALKAISTHRITAVPVFEGGPADCPWAGRCIGWLDMRSIMLYLAWGKYKVDPENSSGVVFDSKLNFGKTQVKELLRLSPENETSWVYPADKPVQLLVDAFSKGVHRALVSFPPQDGKQSHRIEFVTQTDIVRWIYHSQSAFGSCLDRSIREMIVEGKKLATIRDHDTALDGLRKASQLDLSAVGIVDSAGKLVGNLSASDLRGLDVTRLHEVVQDVRQFLQKHSPTSLQPQTVPVSATLRSAVQKMLQNRLHRVWIVDAAGAPVGVCSMTDICFQVMLQSLSSS